MSPVSASGAELLPGQVEMRDRWFHTVASICWGGAGHRPGQGMSLTVPAQLEEVRGNCMSLNFHYLELGAPRL